jgi:hypothetical protein
MSSSFDADFKLPNNKKTIFFLFEYVVLIETDLVSWNAFSAV